MGQDPLSCSCWFRSQNCRLIQPCVWANQEEAEEKIYSDVPQFDVPGVIQPRSLEAGELGEVKAGRKVFFAAINCHHIFSSPWGQLAFLGMWLSSKIVSFSNSLELLFTIFPMFPALPLGTGCSQRCQQLSRQDGNSLALYVFSTQ